MSSGWASAALDLAWDDLRTTFEGDDGVEVEKSWARVAELLKPECGELFRENRSVALDATDRGYGPPQYLPTDVVIEMAAGLGHLDDAELGRRYDELLASGANPYPGVSHRPGGAASNRQ